MGGSGILAPNHRGVAAMTTKAVLYVRVSSEEQAKEGYSLSAQERDGEAYAQRHSFEIVKRWSGLGSAKDQGRANFNEMLDYVKKRPEV